MYTILWYLIVYKIYKHNLFQNPGYTHGTDDKS